jgi:hypothetical protein
MSRWIVLPLALAATAACRDESGGPDAAPLSDAGPPDGGAADAPFAPCAVPDPLGDLGDLVPDEIARQAQPGSTTEFVLSALTILDDGELPDLLYVQLWDGLGAFAGGEAETGDFEIAGVETSLQSCGVCVYIGADYDAASGQYGSVFVAESGTLHVTSITGTFAASLENVVFRHVRLSTVQPQEDHPDMCGTTIASGMFEGEIP